MSASGLFLPSSRFHNGDDSSAMPSLPATWHRNSTGSQPPAKRRASNAQPVSQSPPPDKNPDASEDEEDDIAVEGGELNEDGTNGATEGKVKKTRGSRACGICRRLKMRCVAIEGQTGPPCKRCKSGGHECIFEESLRGRRTNRKRDEMARSLKQMEATLGTVLQSIGKYGMLSEAPGDLMTPGIIEPHPLPSIPKQPTSTSQPLQTFPPPSVQPIDLVTHAFAQSAFPSAVTVPGSSASSASSRGVDPTDNHSQVVLLDDPGYTSSVRVGIHGATHASGSKSTPRLHSLPADSLNPLGLLAEASLQNARKQPVTLNEVLNASNGDLDSPEQLDTGVARKRGLANERYFQPGPLNIIPLRRIILEYRMPAVLLEAKLISPAEVVELFNLYFEKCHLAVPLLDPVLHNPVATGTRSPFLFTTICTVAARYYTKRKDDLFGKCLRICKESAFKVMARGFKSPEICQAMLLLVHWNQPSERYEEERSYQFSGIAIRMAQDLNLHRKTVAPIPEHLTDPSTRALYERELLNRERVWLFCFICDRGIACQMGKPHGISKEDFIIRNSKRWFLQAESQHSDAGLSMMVEMHRIVTRILDTLYSDTRSITGLNVNLDYPVMIQAFLNQLDQWKEDWQVICPTVESDHDTLIRSSMRCFFHEYYRLFVLSFAVQHALSTPESNIDLPKHCAAAFDSAAGIISIARDVLAPEGFFRYCPDSSFVFVSYACCFLLKLVSPTFSGFVNTEKALQLVKDGAHVLEITAVDETHTPALYATFIRALLANRQNNSGQPVESETPEENTSTGHPLDLASLENIFGGHEENLDLSHLNAEGMENLENVNEMIKDGFWDNLLMPGFGGPLQGLMGGSGMFVPPTDPWAFTPMASRVGSRATSPAPFSTQDFDFTS